jgi:hypothetical protein
MGGERRRSCVAWKHRAEVFDGTNVNTSVSEHNKVRLITVLLLISEEFLL